MIARLLPSLRARVLLGTVLVVCVMALGVGGVVAVVARSWVYDNAQQDAFDRFAAVVDESARDRTADDPVLDESMLVLRDGKIINDPNRLVETVPPGLITSVADSTPGTYRFVRLPDARVAIGYHDRENPAISHYTIRPLVGVEEKVGRLMTVLAVSVAAAAALGLATGVVVAHVVVRPLRTVESTVTALAEGDATARMPEQTVRELREMATSFNVMLDDDAAALEILREEERRARRFVADVSHELRTSLAALVPAAEILDEELADDTSPRGRSVRIVSREITRLAELVEDLLEMTQQDAGVGAVTVTDTDIADLVVGALDQRGWHEVAVTGGPADARTDPRRLGAVVTNLVGNAIRHGAEPITVHIGGDEQTVTIAVGDHGQGVPEAHLPRIFERLYKVSEARTRSAGVGLGLAIARENARLLGGDVTYGRAGGVTTFTATVPRDTEAGGDRPD